MLDDPPHSPFDVRVDEIMRVLNDHADITGKRVMYAFNIIDELDAMQLHYDKVVDTNGPLYFTFRPEISDNGKVVFKAWEQGQSGEAVYTGPNPATDVFVRVPHPEFQTLRAYTINDVGTVAFTAQYGGTQTTAITASS